MLQLRNKTFSLCLHCLVKTEQLRGTFERIRGQISENPRSGRYPNQSKFKLPQIPHNAKGEQEGERKQQLGKKFTNKLRPVNRMQGCPAKIKKLLGYRL